MKQDGSGSSIPWDVVDLGRDEFERACRDDPPLRRELESLLAQPASDSDRFAEAVRSAALDVLLKEAPPAPGVGDRLKAALLGKLKPVLDDDIPAKTGTDA